MGLTLCRSARCADCPALLALGVHGETRCAVFDRFAQTIAMSMLTMRAARATPKAALLGDTECGPPAHGLPRGRISAVMNSGLRTAFGFGNQLLHA